MCWQLPRKNVELIHFCKSGLKTVFSAKQKIIFCKFYKFLFCNLLKKAPSILFSNLAFSTIGVAESSTKFYIFKFYITFYIFLISLLLLCKYFWVSRPSSHWRAKSFSQDEFELAASVLKTKERFWAHEKFGFLWRALS